MLEKLKEEVWRANLELNEKGLVTLTWGNASGIDRSSNLIVIKPSGVEYSEMQPQDMVVVNFKNEIIEGILNPSSDTLIHIELYKKLKNIGGITHTHSKFATEFAQACREIPCLGTTHADHFFGTIPVTRLLSEEEVNSNYEMYTGKVILECFKKIDPDSMPAVLVAGHAPFTWGKDVKESVKNAIVLECIAGMASGTYSLNPTIAELPSYITNKHYLRKHGMNAYYGQKTNTQS